MHSEVPRTFTHDRPDRVATEVEEQVKKEIPNSDVLVHFDAITTTGETILDRVRLISSETGHIKTYVLSIYPTWIVLQLKSRKKERKRKENETNLRLYLDLQMDANLDLRTAHDIIDTFKKKVKKEISEIKVITSHIETEVNGSLVLGRDESENFDEEYLQKIQKIALSVPGAADCKDIGIISIVGEIHINLTITIYRANMHRMKTMTIEDVLRIATDVQNIIIKQTGAAR